MPSSSTDQWRRLRDETERATEEQRRTRHELAGGERGPDDGASLELGIGGSRTPTELKCPHAHVAYALARHVPRRLLDAAVRRGLARLAARGHFDGSPLAGDPFRRPAS